MEVQGDRTERLAELVKKDRQNVKQERMEGIMAVRKTKQGANDPENSGSEDKSSETYRIAYMFESNVWGQAMFLEEPKNGMVLITASDFDSGQTVRIGLDVDTFKKLCKTGMAFAAMNEMSGDKDKSEAEE